MKKVIIQKTKKYDHIIGKEVKEEYAFNPVKKSIGFFIDSITNEIDGETWENNLEQLDSIYNNENGEYLIDNGDFYININIKDEDSKTFIINYHTGITHTVEVSDLSEAKKIACDEINYTQEKITIENEDGDVLTTSYWFGVEPKEDDSVLEKIGGGFYQTWTDELGE